jgi:hypothetical protein
MNVTDCLEGRGRTPEQMAADYRALQAAAPTPADKFALMFGHLRPTPETDAFYARLYHPDTPDEMVEGASGEERRMMQRLERQRDELMEALEDSAFGALIRRASGGCGQRQLSSAAQMSRRAESAIAAVKGGHDE